jgi:hypothetical protein
LKLSASGVVPRIDLGTASGYARPKGRPEGSPIEDFVVEDYADHVLGTFKTQKEAIDWARKNGHSPLSRACGISTTRKSPIIGAPPDRRQHSLVNRVACNRTPFTVSNPIWRNRFTLEPFLWGKT